MKRMHVGVLLTLGILVACAGEEVVPVATGPRLGDSTYEKFLVRAETGDPDAQNLVGFMLFFGEGVAQDKVEAHYWFHRAANQGHAVAQVNLAIMHAIGRDAVADPVEAESYYARARSSPAAADRGVAQGDLSKAILVLRRQESDRVSIGQANYEKFCAGCHGLNGVARYIASPSFAIGERMDKSDDRLLDSIANGKGVMPSWKEKLGEEERRQILAYVRTLQGRFTRGIALSLRDTPSQYFTFGPMQDQPFEPRAEPPGIAQWPAE